MQNTDNIDILEIDTRIKQHFQNERNKLQNYIEELEEMKKQISFPKVSTRVKLSLQENIETLEKHIDNIKQERNNNFYIIETALILEEYNRLLAIPLKVKFDGKRQRSNKSLSNLINAYLEIANKYDTVDIVVQETKKAKISCQNCKNSKEFDIEEGNLYICAFCSAQQYILKNVSSYKDINRINLSTKYLYDRSVHFRDAIQQYGAKQNCTIAKEIYEDLEKQFELHGLLIGSKNDPQFYRFSNITKEHINMFLKELDYTKEYENTNLIYYNMTGNKPDEIGHLEEKLLDDFFLLTQAYDKLFKHLDRKNFLNTQYILYQLLMRHKHPCSKIDFSMLKTLERKAWHDDICKTLFEHLGWTFISFY